MSRVQKRFEKPSLTKQSFRDECDVNVLMKRFRNVHGVDFLNRYQGYLNGQFGDFSSVVDYRTALDQISEARGYFEALPAKVRSRFSNDPAEFLDFVQNPENRDELISMGLIEPRVDPQSARPGDRGTAPEGSLQPETEPALP